ncbi:hypothetical protein FM109_17285 [Vibrio casei]|nr:hypothetical protein FM109_17285 [Vibrio casei]
MTLIIRAPHAKNNNLFLVYQPLVSSKTNQMLGEREALIPSLILH